MVGGIACTPEGLGSRTAISEPDPERVDTIDFQEVAASSPDGWRIEAGLAPGIGVCVRSSGFDGLDDDPVCMDKALLARELVVQMGFTGSDTEEIVYGLADRNVTAIDAVLGDDQRVSAALVNGGWVLDLPRVPELRAIEVTADGEVVTCRMSPDLVAAIRCPPRAS